MAGSCPIFLFSFPGIWLHSPPMRTASPHSIRPGKTRNSPVFVDTSGRRRRFLGRAALTVGCMCTGYLVLLVVVFGGLLQPGPQPAPGQADPLPHPAGHHAPAGPDDPRRPVPSEEPSGAAGSAVPAGRHSSRAPGPADTDPGHSAPTRRSPADAGPADAPAP